MNHARRIGVGGPVGSGKTRLIERLLPCIQAEGLEVAVITNDLVTTEDAARLQRSGLIDPRLVLGVKTGACPHTAIREDPSANLDATERLEREWHVDAVFIESGGDNLSSTFSSDLADYWMYVIDTAAGDDIPRKRGLGILQADLLVVNKVDLAPFVGADLALMRHDLGIVRPDRPTVFTDLKSGLGVQDVFGHVRAVLLDSAAAR